MPELPEVEATRRHLEPVLTGAVVTRVEVLGDRVARHQPAGEDFAVRLMGRCIIRVGRRGKFLLAELDQGLVWVTHLGMSGRLELAGPADPYGRHIRLVVGLGSGREVRFVDPRTFGFSSVLSSAELASTGAARLGPDALGSLPTAAWMREKLGRRKAPIKAVLLDQHFLAGLGNIYADEVLYQARIRPDRPSNSLSGDEVSRLRSAVLPVLRAGLRRGGTSLADMAYLLPDGRAGENLGKLRAYGREGLPCRRCRSPIKRVVLRGRSAFFCERCQQ